MAVELSRDAALRHAEERRNAALRSLECSITREELERAMKLREMEIEMEVANATDENGKPLFSNADKRRAEVASRLQSDTSYQEMLRSCIQLERDARAAAIEAEFHRDLVRILVAFANREGDDD